MRRKGPVESKPTEGPPENEPIVITYTKLKYIITVSVVVLIIQLCGLKYLLDRMQQSTTPIEERTPWEAVKLLLQISDKVGLPVFTIEPSLVRAVREESERRIELWNQQPHSVVTLGVKESDTDVLHQVVSAMQNKGYSHWEKQDEDPRGISSAIERSYKVITTHTLLWVPVEAHTPMLIHLVTFFERYNYFWHAVAQDQLHQPPFDLSQSLFGKTSGSYSLFSLKSSHIDGVKVQYPQDPSAFLKEIETSEFIECNHTQAHDFNTHYGLGKRDENFAKFQRKARQLLVLAKNALDSLAIPFWLSSGTCLGWYRECDLISYTTDVDIGIFIKYYQENIVTAFETEGLMLTHFFGKGIPGIQGRKTFSSVAFKNVRIEFPVPVSDSLELSFLYGDLKLDIFFFYETNDYMWNGGTQAKTGNKYKYIFPKFNLCWTEFLELWVMVPCPTLPYIHANYGSKWMYPDKNWDWKSSPNNVIENGQWPKEEWDDIIQLYE